MNEAVITFVMSEINDKVLAPYTRVVRIEFEGTAEDFMMMRLQGSQASELRIVAMETLGA